MLYMAVSFNDPLVQLGLFICAYIIVTGVCSYFGYSSDQYGIYMTFTAFMLSVIMILPDPINFGDTFNTIVPLAGVTSVPFVNTNNAASTTNTNLITSITNVFTSVLASFNRNNKVLPGGNETGNENMVELKELPSSSSSPQLSRNN